MAGSTAVFVPTAPSEQRNEQVRRTLETLQGSVVGFIDNAKPNFDHLVDDLGELLVTKYGVSAVVKHRKRGQVPVDETVLKALAQQCDAVITGSGD